MTSSNIYYVYIYIHPISNIPFYVGYGKNKRHLDHLNDAKRDPIPKPKEHKLNTIRKILKEGLEPIIQIIDSNLSKEHACELEIFLISEIGRADKGEGPLTNLTMGGDGNRDWTPELRKEASERQMGMISAKDPITNKKFRVHNTDNRWISGALVGQNLGEVNSNVNGKLNGYILAKDSKGNTFKVKSNDPRWISGALVGFNKNCKAHPNLIAAWRSKRGIPKTKEHNEKNSAAIKLLKWYCDFENNIVRRFKEGEHPVGFARVSGPHKRELI